MNEKEETDMANDTKVYRAGIIPYYIKEDQIQMMFMVPFEKKFGGEKPQIAKGKVEAEEDELETACREGREELGLYRGNIVGDPHKLGVFHGRTTYFVAEIENPDMFGDPGNETKEVHWLTPDQFKESGRLLHVPVVNAAVRYITRKGKKDV